MSYSEVIGSRQSCKSVYSAGRRFKLLVYGDIILRNTGKKPTATQKLVAGAVQSELNSILNSTLAVDGWYGKQAEVIALKLGASVPTVN